MNIYVTVPGITGMATDANHKGQIPVQSYSVSKSRNVDMKVGYNSNREGGGQRFSYFELTKVVDKSSPQLYQLFATGRCLDKVVIQICRTGAGAQVYHEFTLYNAIIVEREVYNDTGDMSTGTEYLALAYTRLDEKFIPYDVTNQTIGTPIIVGYDLEKTQSC